MRLPPEWQLRMQTAIHAAGCNDDAVGLAWLLRDLGGERFFGHTGQTVGYLSEILLQRQRGFALVVLTNALADGGLRAALRERVLKLALGLEVRAPQPLSPPPASLAEYQGSWRGPFEALERARRRRARRARPRAAPATAPPGHLDAAAAAALALGLLRAGPHAGSCARVAARSARRVRARRRGPHRLAPLRRADRAAGGLAGAAQPRGSMRNSQVRAAASGPSSTWYLARNASPTGRSSAGSVIRTACRS